MRWPSMASIHSRASFAAAGVYFSSRSRFKSRSRDIVMLRRGCAVGSDSGLCAVASPGTRGVASSSSCCTRSLSVSPTEAAGNGIIESGGSQAYVSEGGLTCVCQAVLTRSSTSIGREGLESQVELVGHARQDLEKGPQG